MPDIVFGVSQINEYLSRKIYTDLFLSNLSIMGEVTNFSMSSTGHAFFSLKDESGMIDCIIYDFESNETAEAVIDGEKIIAKGKVTFYKRGGSIQFAVSSALPQGAGDLYAKFEHTKAMLKEEGIFEQIYKKPLPEFPGHIGVVTSAAGAAVHDIINVATRRFEGIRITVYPAKVQGEGAARQIAAGINYFNDNKDVDVIIVGRGGGSFEDLFAFNEEIVARSVFASKIPVVSAVGHETDFSLCDMAADLRSPTPSAAAELVVKDKRAVLQYIENYDKYIYDQLQKTISDADRRLGVLQTNIKSYPFELLTEQAEQKINSIVDFLRYNILLSLERKQMSLEKFGDSLEDLNPKKVLQRGYAIVYDDKKRVVTSSKGKEKKLDIELSDGHIIVERKV